MDYAAFFQKRLAQAYRAADEAIRTADDSVVRIRSVSQLFLRLCTIEQDIQRERDCLIRRKAGRAIITSLNGMLKSIDADINSISDAVYDKHLGHPDQPYVPMHVVALQIISKYL